MISIEDSLGFSVVRTARGMKKVLESRLLLDSGVTASQHLVLSTLAHEDGLALSEIGKRVFLDKPAISGLADRLEKDGLVIRKRYKTDRRVVRLFLTEKGRNVLTNINTIVEDIDNAFTNLMTNRELATLRDLLDRLWSHSLERNGNGNS